MSVEGTRIPKPAAPGEAAVRPARTLKPKDAATLVLVDQSGTEPRVLMGRRRASQVFLPNKYVFPGGRVDRGDRTVPTLDELVANDRERLLFDMKGRPSAERARALALAAIRETFEEAGLLFGVAPPAGSRDPSRKEALAASTATRQPRHATWQRFLARGHLPTLSGLTFFARAITPPARPRRYDTRFFLADAARLSSAAAAPDDELSDIGWFTLDEMRALDLPNITRAVVEDLAQRLATPGRALPVPYYRYERGTFHRELIT